ncbi:MAG: cation transporter [Oscillospiraceae bacterium]|nr:cation transporter [Oscillospiraceae bacterium]
MEVKLIIEGMMCPKCEARCRKALEAVAGVEKAEVSHKEGSALVTGAALDPAALKAAVEEAGYKVLS